MNFEGEGDFYARITNTLKKEEYIINILLIL
jgi:hypothetical protein